MDGANRWIFTLPASHPRDGGIASFVLEFGSAIRAPTYWGRVRIPNVESFKLLSDELILMHSDPLKVLSRSMACDVEVREGRIAAVRSAPAFV